MDEEYWDAVAGALAAQNFLLENVYAMFLVRDRNPVEACRTTARECRRQFEDLPPSNPGEVDQDEGCRITRQGLHHLERFWASVESRLQKHMDR